MTRDSGDEGLSWAISGLSFPRMLDLVSGGWHRCDPSWRGETRREPSTKLYVPAAGSAQVDCGAGLRLLKPGRIYLIPGDRPHSYRCDRRFDLWWLHVRPGDRRLAQRLAALPDLLSWPLAGRDPVWQRLATYFPERRLPDTLALTAWVLALLAGLPHVALPESRRLDEVRAWLDTAATADPPLPEIARQAGLSPSQLARVARREWGESPRARVRRLRLERSRDLLVYGGLTVAAVAQRLGFADAPSFTKAFRRQFGLPPDAWRRQAGP